jgi:hypothetical protein
MSGVPATSFTTNTASPPQPRAPRAATATDADGAVDWGSVIASADQAALHRPHRRKNPSPASMGVAIVLGLGIVGATAWFVNKKMHQPPPVVVIRLPAPPPAAHPVALPPVPMSTDDADDQSGSDAANDGSPATTAPANSTADDNEPPDPHAGDPDWPDILIAHDMPDQGVALLRYDDYRRRNPGKNDAILKQFEAEAFDRMWWRRIVQLCHRRDRLTGEIAEKDKVIATESDPSFKTQLQTEKASLLEDRKSAQEALQNEMGFTAEQGPDLNDDKAIDAARAVRSADKFAAWSKEIGNYIRRNNGSTPWGNEDL